MTKPKRETVRLQMTDRLRLNRDGRLTSDQWLTITAEPLSGLLLLLAPAILIMGVRLPLLAARGWWLALILIAAGAVMLLLRARRYARLPLRAETMYAAEQPLVRRLIGNSAVFYDAGGKVYRFSRWLAPRIPLKPNQGYLVYFLADADQTVLCSLIPEDDPEKPKFQPTREFENRFARRVSMAGSG